jgi:hypothetical protein
MIQYSDESLESRWYREHSIRIHMKRLKDIKARNFSIDPSPTRFYSVNRRKNRFKQNEMIRENIVLYDKLTQISERRKNKTGLKGPKSLNISIRKKEADRIIQDNFEFVKRLTEKESIFSVKKLRKDFDVQEKYKNSISRHNLHERLKKITDSELKLPPINQEYVKGSSTSRVSNHSRTSKSGIKSEKINSNDLLVDQSLNNEKNAKFQKKGEKTLKTEKKSKVEKKTEVKEKKNEKDNKPVLSQLEESAEIHIEVIESVPLEEPLTPKDLPLEKPLTPKDPIISLNQEENPLLLTQVDPDTDLKPDPAKIPISEPIPSTLTEKISDLPSDPIEEDQEAAIENS